MKLTKTKLKQIIKEVLKESGAIGRDASSKEAESDGWRDYGDSGNRYKKWETFEGGKYLVDYELGYDNANVEQEREIA